MAALLEKLDKIVIPNTPVPGASGKQRHGATHLHFMTGLRGFLAHAFAFKKMPTTRETAPEYGTPARELFQDALASIGSGKYKENFGYWGGNFMQHLRHAGVYAPGIVPPPVASMDETASANTNYLPKYKPYVDALVEFGVVTCLDVGGGAVIYHWTS